MPSADRRREIAIAALLVVLAASLPYLSTIDNYFLQDDFGVVQLMGRRSWTMFFRWFTVPWMEDIWSYTPDEIRPFVALTYVMTSWFDAGSPVAHHVLNIAIHAANGLLVMQLSRTVAGLGPVPATLAGLCFVLLPVQVESVAWITGRVDSMPTLFYLAAFLAYTRWRCGSKSAYWWALAWYFVALFSKQNTITLPAALVAFDVLIRREPLQPSWRGLRPYVPFVLMTAGFLGLRYLTVGTVLRESQLNAGSLRLFSEIVVRHTSRVVMGHAGEVRPWEWIGLVVIVAAGVAALRWLMPSERRSLIPGAVFAVVWWVLGVAPVIAAGYESPRHVYLAAAGWTILLGIVVEALLRNASAVRWRGVVQAGGAAVLVFYTVQLTQVVRQWNTAAVVSQRAVAGLEREVLAAPAGTLFIVGVPVRSWEWALPFAAQPPFAGTDLVSRASIVTPRLLYCCRSQWLDHTRKTLRAWAAQPQPAPVVALYFDPETGVMSRRSDAEYPALRVIVQTLIEQRQVGPELDQVAALDRPIVRVLHELVAPVRPRDGDLRIR